MLDGIDPGANGALGPFGAVGMRGGFPPQRVRLVHQRVEFGLG